MSYNPYPSGHGSPSLFGFCPGRLQLQSSVGNLQKTLQRIVCKNLISQTFRKFLCKRLQSTIDVKIRRQSFDELTSTHAACGNTGRNYRELSAERISFS